MFSKHYVFLVSLVALFLVHSACVSFARPWDPLVDAATNVIALYDASDVNSITESGGAVSQWDDKSGNGYHMKQSNSSLQPTYSASDPVLGGFPSISNVDAYKDLIMDQTSTVQRVYFVAYYYDGVTNTWVSHDALFSTIDGSIRLTGRSSGNQVFDGNRTTQNFDYDGTTFRNGSTNDTNAQSGGLPITNEMFVVTAASPQTGQWRLLGNSSSWSNWDGGLGELIFTDGTEGLDVQQKIEGYLAWKWGIEGRLPSYHPYKLAAPDVPPSGTVILIK